jgi:hypothetical protein
MAKGNFGSMLSKWSPLTARGGKFSVAFRMIVPQAEKSGTSRFRLFRQHRSYPDLQRPVTMGLKCAAKLTFDPKRRQCTGLQTYTKQAGSVRFVP